MSVVNPCRAIKYSRTSTSSASSGDVTLHRRESACIFQAPLVVRLSVWPGRDSLPRLTRRIAPKRDEERLNKDPEWPSGSVLASLKLDGGRCDVQTTPAVDRQPIMVPRGEAPSDWMQLH